MRYFERPHVDPGYFVLRAPWAMILGALERGDAQLSPRSNQVKIFDLCWRKLNLKFGSRFFSIEISQNFRKSKNKDFNWNLSYFWKIKISKFFDFLKFSIEIQLFRNFSISKIFRKKSNFLKSISKKFYWIDFQNFGTWE